MTATESAARADERRAERARTEPMTVRPLRDGRYVVETEGGVYVADLEAAACTCPDHSIRGARCKHLRRVARDVTAGRVPAPDRRAAACAVCGRRLHVGIREGGPHLCDRHDHRPGDVVRDREDGSALLVVAATGARADEHETDDGRPVAEYPSNVDYGDHEPVFEAVYLGSIRPDRPGAARRYAFPASRLVRTGRRLSTPSAASDAAAIPS
jgi:hypothetical protein